VEHGAIVNLGSSHEVEFESPDLPIVEFGEFEVGLDGSDDAGVIEALGDAIAIASVSDGPFEGGKVVLAVGGLNVCEQLGSLVNKMESAAKEIAGCSHLGGIDVGLRDHTASEECSDLMGVDLVVLRLSAVDCLHVERVAKDEGNALSSTEVGEPVPGEHALGGDDEVFAIGVNGTEKGRGSGSHLPVEPDLTLGIEYAEVEGACVQIDAAVK